MTSPHHSLFLLGSSHHTAPLEIREKIALAPAQIDSLYRHLHDSEMFEECLVLNTCNRVEVYLVSGKNLSHEDIAGQVSVAATLEPSLLSRHGFWLTGRDAIKHLYEVSAGLDSQMVGETEIFGQVKNAYATATEKGAAGPFMHRLFQKSFQAAKWVRTNTGVSRGHVSIGNVVVDLATRIFGNLKNSRTLVVGTGEVGAASVKALYSRGVRKITITSRTFENAEALTSEVEGIAISFSNYHTILSDFDIIVCSTAAPEAVLKTTAIEKFMSTRRNQPLFLIDLAMPRDVEETAGDLPNVFLYNLDDLAAIANENLKSREAEIDKCRQALTARADHLWQSLNGNSDPA